MHKNKKTVFGALASALLWAASSGIYPQGKPLGTHRFHVYCLKGYPVSDDCLLAGRLH
jgi:hypothetical protein